MENATLSVAKRIETHAPIAIMVLFAPLQSQLPRNAFNSFLLIKL